MVKSHGATVVETVLVISLVAALAIPAALNLGIYSGDNVCGVRGIVDPNSQVRDINSQSLYSDGEGNYRCLAKTLCGDAKPGSFCKEPGGTF